MTTQDVWIQYHNDLKQYIISKVRDINLADDILQEAFIKIHTKLHTLNEVTKLKSWIFSITRNTIIDHLKSKNRVADLSEIESEDEPHTSEHTEADCLRGILSHLPKKYRDPLFLSDIRGMKQQEVAKQLKLPVPTVKSQIQRARKLIAQGFMDCCGFIMNKEGKLIGEIQEKENCKVCS